MPILTLVEAQRRLLNIVVDVEEGRTTPEEAADQLSDLKSLAATANLNFKAEYTLEDFRKILRDVQSTYESSTASDPEPSYESSTSW